jgi:hypothetical protein
MAIVLIRMMVIGGMKRDEGTSRSTYMSLSSSAPDFEVRGKEMLILAITFSNPCKMAARCPLVPPTTQNCSCLHQSSSIMLDHITSKMASMHSVRMIVKR